MPEHTVFINRKQLAEMFGVTTNTIKNWSKKGKFPQPVYTVEKTYLYQVSDIEKWVKRQLDAKSILSCEEP